jgi:glycosyltransferase involved in cell wall biosynthesis
MANPATILLALMKLDIGGAETHAVVLARHLKEMGYRVVMASYGGCFEKEIASYGVKHYRVPLHQPKISLLGKSLFALRRIVQDEKVDLIHAHARIPAFVTAIMGRPKNVRFITTAHFNFDYRYGLKYLSQWGEKTIAVSEDIKTHLIRHFRVPAEKITVIPNGIDTASFRPDLPVERNGEVTTVTYVSRLDGELASVALNLLSAFALVFDLAPELRLVIVGDGNRRAEVEKAARDFNAAKGGEFVSMLGARTDVNMLMAKSDLVVGVSRVALEAMACARPVLLAGPQGFGGLLDTEKMNFFQKDNFTARLSNEKATAENLAAGLKAFLQKPVGWRVATGKVFRQLVAEEYSSLGMARKTARVYEELLRSRPD